MNLDQIEAEFEQYLIRCFGSTWERSGIMSKFKAAIEKAVSIAVTEMKALNEASDYEYEKQLRAAQGERNLNEP